MKPFNCLFVCLLYFVLQYIDFIGHLMPNQVKKNNSEEKFKGEVFGINDKLQIISWLIIIFFLLGVYLLGIMIIPHQKNQKKKTKQQTTKPKEKNKNKNKNPTMKQIREGISLLEYI